MRGDEDGDTLDAKLRQAGIIADDDRADAVLARLKQQRGE
jgi:hypothetical protein